MLPTTLETSLSSLYSISSCNHAHSFSLSLFFSRCSFLLTPSLVFNKRDFKRGDRRRGGEEKCLFIKESFAFIQVATRIVTAVKRNKGRRNFYFRPRGSSNLSSTSVVVRTRPVNPTLHSPTSTAGSLFRCPLDLSDRYSPSVCTSVFRYFYLAPIRMAGAKLPRSAYTWEIRKLRNY